MSSGEVSVERRGAVALVTLRRPHKRNALDASMWRGLSTAAAALAAEPPRAVVVTGEGEAFCAGMDVGMGNPQIMSIAQAAQAGDVDAMRRFLGELRPSFDGLLALPVPVIAAIKGLAYGGGAELAVRCDLRVMAREATLCFSEVRLGLMPDLGGTVALSRLVGTAVAADLLLTARPLDGAEAAALGLVNRLCDRADVVATALALAEQIARNGPRAVRATLAVLRRTPDLTASAALALEREAAAHLIASGECAHGLAAFASRSEPTFPDP